jgi:RNA-dependent RNA polymerase
LLIFLKAVDYPKQGIAPNLEGDRLPRTLIRCKPDWHAAEVVSPRQTDYYESSRALGHLFRSIKLDDPKPIPAGDLPPSYALCDPISVALLAQVQPYLQESAFINQTVDVVDKLFQTYCDELRYICATHTISNTPGVRLLEAEIVVGTILAKCSQKRWRKERIYRMRTHTGTLVWDVQHGLLENPDTDSTSELVHGLSLAWNAWDFSLRRQNDFGANSFGLIALSTIFDCLKALNKLSIA